MDQASAGLVVEVAVAVAAPAAHAVVVGGVVAVALARAVNAQYLHPAWEDKAAEPHRLLTRSWIDQIRAARLGIICWHEERPSEIAALRQLGVDGICSNAPDLLLADSDT